MTNFEVNSSTLPCISWPQRKQFQHALTPVHRRDYHPRMATLHSLQGSLGQIGRTGARWTTGWWHVAQMGALVLVLALSPATYHRGGRAVLARHIVTSTAPLLPWFSLLAALISVVLIRIVVVTATSYHLSHYAIDMMVRVLVLELIPMSAALFVALYVTVPGGAELVRMQARGDFVDLENAGFDPLRHEILPRVVAGIFAVLLLAAISCLIALVLAYVAVYGFGFGAFRGFTHTIGQIFNPAVALIFMLKTFFFSVAVALIPVAAFLRARRSAHFGGNPELESMARLFAALLLIEVLSLIGNYA